MSNVTIYKGYVQCEPLGETVYVSLIDGKIDLSVYFSNEIAPVDGLEEAMQSWINDSAPVIISPHFSIASPVDYLIDGHQMPARKNNIDLDAKPIFDALREELVEQVKRIDALTYE